MSFLAKIGHFLGIDSGHGKRGSTPIKMANDVIAFPDAGKFDPDDGLKVVSGDPNITGTRTYEYEADKETTSKTVKDSANHSTTIEYIYDEHGRKSGGITSDGETFEYVYDGDDLQPSAQIVKDADGNVLQTYEYSYENGVRTIKNTLDANGNVYNPSETFDSEAQSINEDAVSIAHVSDNFNNGDNVTAMDIDYDNKNHDRYEYEYDNLGRKTFANVDDGTRIEYKYEGDSTNVSSQILYDNDGNVVSTHRYTYDESGNLANQQIINSDGYLKSEMSYTYNDGQLTQTSTHDYLEGRITTSNYSDGKEVKYEIRNYLYGEIETNTFSYNDDGSYSVRKTTFMPASGQKPTEATIYYNSDGIPIENQAT